MAIESGRDAHGFYGVVTCDRCGGHLAVRPLARGPLTVEQEVELLMSVLQPMLAEADWGWDEQERDLCGECRASALAGQGRA